jgi:hypothetical protein
VRWFHRIPAEDRWIATIWDPVMLALGDVVATTTKTGSGVV